MYFKEKFNLKNYLPVVIFFLALLFNQFSGNRGVFPIDTFSHFDIGYRVLNGEYGVKNLYAGVPVIIGKNGIEKIVEINLSIDEKKNFDNSISAVKDLFFAAKKIYLKLS